MKAGFRKSSPHKSISSRTIGNVSKTVKSSFNPFYGKKGAGLTCDTSKSLYNKVYKESTSSLFDVFK